MNVVMHSVSIALVMIVHLVKVTVQEGEGGGEVLG